MTLNSAERITLVKTALGKEPFDTIISDVRIVNVYSNEIIGGAIGIKNGRVVSFRADRDAEAQERFSADGMYALPGFIDTHVHIDSTLLTPEGMVELIAPHGTTALFADPMEIANVAGLRGLEALFVGTQRIPCHVYLEIPSRVPTAPGLETTGGELNLDDVKELLQWEQTISLGELDPSKILGLRSEYFDKIEAAQEIGKIVNGHAIGLSGADLEAYACGGLADDHECVTFEEAKNRIELGLAVLIREGSTERNLDALVQGILREKVDTQNWMMCTDDKHPNEILREGHINYMVNKSIALGLEPIRAIQMATINAARHFRLDHEIGSISPGRWADIILSEKISEIKPVLVLHKGKIVARKGKLASPPPNPVYPEWLYKTVKTIRGRTPVDFHLPASKELAQVHVIEILPNQIINKSGSAILQVSNGHVQQDVAKDILKLAVVERHGKNGNIGITFVKGFHLQKGAISSSISHDHHNIVIVGADDESMATCVRETEEMQGGFVVAVGGQVLGKLPLPIGGLMSPEKPDKVIESLDQINDQARSLGCNLPAPFMTLSFISLPTVPELGLTDMGLVDVKNHQLISPFLQ